MTHENIENDEQWQFEKGDVVVEDDTFAPSFEGVGSVASTTEFEVKYRFEDFDTGEKYYFTEYSDGGVVKTSLKSASMVHGCYNKVD